jgi:hypothetical protein
MLPPSIAVSPHVGGTLTAEAGTWNGTDPITLAHRWQRCDADGCDDIPGATSLAYSVTAADLGFALRLCENATNPVGSETADSAPTATIVAGNHRSTRLSRSSRAGSRPDRRSPPRRARGMERCR